MSSIRTSSPRRPSRWWRPVSDEAERQLHAFIYDDVGTESLFAKPVGEAALVPLDVVNARVYGNPLTVYIGGMAAVVLELAEPRVRHGVWDHSIFPERPVLRLRRTGIAAMVTVYAARSTALDMIAGVTRRHARVSGTTDRGVAYSALDPELLAWVQATAAYGFLGAYDRFAGGLSAGAWDRALAEACPVARAYGVERPLPNRKSLEALIAATAPRLEASSTLSTFLDLMRTTPVLPPPGHHLQPLFVRAAVSLVPGAIRERLRLTGAGLRPGEGVMVRLLARSAGLLSLRNHPRSLAMQRLSAGDASAHR